MEAARQRKVPTTVRGACATTTNGHQTSYQYAADIASMSLLLGPLLVQVSAMAPESPHVDRRTLE